MSNDVLTTRQLAERWGVAQDTLRVHRHNGNGPAWYRVPTGGIRYRLADVQIYEDTHRRTGGIDLTSIVKCAVESARRLENRNR